MMTSTKQTTKPVMVCASLLAALALQGCATTKNPDPLESWNRKVFAFNDTLDEKVLRPVASGYRKVTPEPLRIGFTNFVNNIKDVWSTANLFLQGRFTDGTLGVMRVSVNSTFGLLGVIDIATPMQLERPNEDLGQTFGVWGAKPGAYLVWPILGPSTVRDSLGLPADMHFSASVVGGTAAEKNLLRLWQGVNLRSGLLNAGDLLNDVALDKYAFVRDAYLQRRQNLIYEGDPPSDGEDEPYEDEPYEDAGAAQKGKAGAGTPPAAASSSSGR
jgi:phospholipid-binding lipoprotein MlaA